MSIPPWAIAAIFAILLAIVGRSVNGALIKMIVYFLCFMLGLSALAMAASDWRFWLLVIIGLGLYIVTSVLKARAKKRKEDKEKEKGGNATTNNFFFGEDRRG